jgi:hypothetical protein
MSYVNGGPIGSSRLISADEQSVTFWAREGSKTGGGLIDRDCFVGIVRDQSMICQEFRSQQR